MLLSHQDGVSPELEDRTNPSKFSHPLIKNGLQWALSFPLQNFNLAPVIWHLACDLAKLLRVLSGAQLFSRVISTSVNSDNTVQSGIQNAPK